MNPEHIESNLKSWNKILEFIEELGSPQWDDWRKLANRFMQYGISHEFNLRVLHGFRGDFFIRLMHRNVSIRININ